MDDDVRLNAQLRSLGKKLFQFRDLIAKIEIPESLPPPPLDTKFWESFTGKCSSASTVLKQIHTALTPDMFHLAVFPGEKVWQNPAAVPDLLSVPPRIGIETTDPIASNREEVLRWNTALEQANHVLEDLLSTSDTGNSASEIDSKFSSKFSFVHGEGSTSLIETLLTKTSSQRLGR